MIDSAPAAIQRNWIRSSEQGTGREDAGSSKFKAGFDSEKLISDQAVREEKKSERK